MLQFSLTPELVGVGVRWGFVAIICLLQWRFIVKVQTQQIEQMNEVASNQEEIAKQLSMYNTFFRGDKKKRDSMKVGTNGSD